MIFSPMTFVSTSRSAASCTSCSISSTSRVRAFAGTGRFSQARCSPAMSFERSKASLRPSFLITRYGISSIRS
jgi:hypothetical protein